jgi:hypothetical protein
MRCGLDLRLRYLAAPAREDVAFIDPYFNTDDTKGGVSLNLPIIDVGTKRLERYTPLDLFLRAGNFCSAQPTTTDNLDSFGVCAHRFLHGLLHGAAERDTLLKLFGDAAPDQTGV